MNIVTQTIRRAFILCAAAAAFAASLNAAQINTFGRLEISADDYSFSARVTARLHMDANFYESDSEDKQLISGAFARRARIGLMGNIREWDYAIESDFAAETAELKDAYLARVLGPGKLHIGQFKQFEGLEKLTSSSDLIFMERSYLSNAMPNFQIGAGYRGTAEMIGFSANVYNRTESSTKEEPRPDDPGLGVALRSYIAPLNSNLLAVHLGGSYAEERTGKDGSRLRVSPAGRAEDYEGGADYRFILFNRRDEKAEISRLNLESLAINGPLLLQAEFMKGSARTQTKPADDFNAWYAQLSYLLTGEAHTYNFRQGEIKNPLPSRDIGAFEISARYQAAEREKEPNAKLTAMEFGLTYYANMNVRFLLNYSLVNNRLLEDRPRLLAMRAQFDF